MPKINDENELEGEVMQSMMIAGQSKDTRRVKLGEMEGMRANDETED